MGWRRIVSVFALVLPPLLVLSLMVVPQPARAVSPQISNVTWTPEVPASEEMMTIEADIVSPGGPPQVFAPVCTLPPVICVPHEMFPDGDGHYATPPFRAPSKSMYDVNITGAYFNVTAVDPGGNFSFTDKIYIEVADVISVTATLTPSSALPGDSVEIRGGAEYDSNDSAPAKFSRVDFRIVEVGTTWSTSTDGSGAFVSNFPAPASIGSYAINVMVTNRTIAGSHEKYLVVSTSPTPDLAVRSNSLSVQPLPALAGDLLTVSFSVENRGDAPAGAFIVTVAVKDSSGTAVYTRDFSMGGMPAGDVAALSATWVSAEGPWQVSVWIDSGGTVPELSDANNWGNLTFSVDAAARDGPSAILIVGMAIGGIGVAAAAAFAHRWRTGRRKGP
jgi:hypothetical protein